MNATLQSHRAGRALSLVPRYGLAGTAERVRRRLIRPLTQRLFVDERHVWYSVPFAEDGDVIPEAFDLRRGGPEDLAAVAEIGGVSPRTGADYLARGAELYVVYHGDDLAFTTWIHVGAVPLAAARGGWMDLPEGVVSFEDSLTAPDYRTTRIAMKAIDAITYRQAQRGVWSIITRIAEDNTVARKWARRCGGVEVATMHRRCIGPVRRVSITPIEGGHQPTAELLIEQVV
jgi:GNAT superfamily N-acetyltransferase